MSCNYAEGLSPYENKGKLGVPEVFDNDAVVEDKVQKLAEWMKVAKHTVVYTGAGVSTAAGIPDFRGPKGVWTLEEKGLKPEVNVSFDHAIPTDTHMGLLGFVNSGHVKYVVSQNIDGLHMRSGLRREHVSELHGNMFVTQCNYCDKQFVQSQPVPTVGQKEVGSSCLWVKARDRKCRGRLRDNILDWDHNLPERELDAAIFHSTLSDLSICLGTTLQILPAGNLPLKAQKNGGKFVIVNLQPTKHIKRADLVIHTQVDKVFRRLSELLEVPIPVYESEKDPTQSLILCKSLKTLEWTITAPMISKLRKCVAQISPKSTQSQRQKPLKKRKSRIKEESDSECDEKETPPKAKVLKMDLEETIVSPENKYSPSISDSTNAACVKSNLKDGMDVCLETGTKVDMNDLSIPTKVLEAGLNT